MQLWLVVGFGFLLGALGFTKVVVPAVYNEWDSGQPVWMSKTMQMKYNYTTWLYQRTDPSASNYSFNRGTEGTIYLKYILDNYNNFPDLAFFVHAKPEDHSINWLDMVKCARPNATYFNINDIHICRNPSVWQRLYGLGEEANQCWRSVLKTVWSYERFSQEVRGPIEVCTTCCQQFVLSREMVLARPYEVWKRLHHMIGVSEMCHSEDGDDHPLSRLSTVAQNHYDTAVRGGTMEHLAHVIFGNHSLIMDTPTMRDICDQFLESSQCPGSPCLGSVTSRIRRRRLSNFHYFD